MATSVSQNQRLGGLLKTARFSVTADNDVLFPAGQELLVLGAFHHSGNTTAVNIDAGVDITAFPVQVGSAETLNVTGTGAGDVTVVFAEIAKPGMETYTN